MDKDDPPMSSGRSDFENPPTLSPSTSLVPAPHARLTEGRARWLYPAAKPDAAVALNDTVRAQIPYELVFSREHGPSSRSPIYVFLLTFVSPLILCIFYLYYIVPDQYVSEIRFSVRSSETSSSTVPSNLTAMLGVGSSSTSTDNYVVVDYIQSEQALQDVSRQVPTSKWLARSVTDVFYWVFHARAPATDEAQLLIDWRDAVWASYDPSTGIAVASVKARGAEESQKMAQALEQSSEMLVNRMEKRSRKDQVRYAEAEVAKAQLQVVSLNKDLVELRQQMGVIDPNSSAVAGNTAVVNSLRMNLANQQAQLATAAHDLSPNAPRMRVMRNQIQATKDQLARLDLEVTNHADKKALAAMVGRFELITGQTSFANQNLQAAWGVLEQVKKDAASQHLYLDAHVEPTRPSKFNYPPRLQFSLIAAAICLCMWTVVSLFLKILQERTA